MAADFWCGKSPHTLVSLGSADFRSGWLVPLALRNICIEDDERGSFRIRAPTLGVSTSRDLIGGISVNHKCRLIVMLCATLLLAGCIQVEIHPTEAEEQHLHNGIAYLEQGRFDEAISEFTAALETYPRYPDAYCNRGGAYGMLGQWDKAISDLSKAIELAPNWALPYSNRGWVYISVGEIERGIADCNKAIELDPDLALAYYNRGRGYLFENNDKAIADSNKAIELDPACADAYIVRGTAYLDKGEFDRAIDDLTRGIQLAPERDAMAYNNRGYAYLEKGDFDLAKRDFNKAIELDTNFAMAYYNRGKTYKALGNNADAIADLKKCIEISQNPALTEAAGEVMEELRTQD